jgi:hypothetical protein
MFRVVALSYSFVLKVLRETARRTRIHKSRPQRRLVYQWRQQHRFVEGFMRLQFCLFQFHSKCSSESERTRDAQFGTCETDPRDEQKPTARATDIQVSAAGRYAYQHGGYYFRGPSQSRSCE